MLILFKLDKISSIIKDLNQSIWVITLLLIIFVPCLSKVVLVFGGGWIPSKGQQTWKTPSFWPQKNESLISNLTSVGKGFCRLAINSVTSAHCCRGTHSEGTPVGRWHDSKLGSSRGNSKLWASKGRIRITQEWWICIFGKLKVFFKFSFHTFWVILFGILSQFRF